MKRATSVALSLLLITALALALAGCGSESESSIGSQPAAGSGSSTGTGNTINGVEQQAANAVREANLKMIDSAIQQYNAANGAYPTDISQLSQYFARGVPTDPLGGTYYIATQNGVATAAVR
jgi:hypothetical protein